MNRDLRLDIVRSFAILGVLICHSFGFEELSAPQDFVRLIGLTGVPLFLILTGYLNHNKTLDDYYVKGRWTSCLRVLIAYILLGSICYLVDRHFYPEHTLSARSWVLELLQFKLTPYAWYIEMWIGLFFLTPILNIIARNMDDRQERYIIITLLCLSSLAAFLNRNGMNVIPDFWVNLYPITLYFIGVWLSRHRLNAKAPVLLALSFVILISEPLMNAVLTEGNRYTYYLGGQNDIVFLVLAVIFFSLLCRINIKSAFMAKAIVLVSKTSLYIYLISYVFDTIFKNKFMPAAPEHIIERFPYHVLMLVFSFVLSFAVSWIYMFLETKAVNALKRK